MDAVLRQSKAMCPFLKTATPATLRALSTSSRPALPAPASPCGGTMSKLQLLGQRCPVMGKAMAVQTAKNRAAGSVRAFSGHSKTGKAKIHTTRNKEARAVDNPLFEGRDNGMSYYHQYTCFIMPIDCFLTCAC